MKLINWTDGGNHAFKRSCIIADANSGGLKVSYGGLYAIYDHLAVCRCAEHAQFHQTIYRRSAESGDVERLLEDSSTGESQRGGEGCVGEPAFSSDLFGVVGLEDGDFVWIEAKPASAVYRPNRASFFGLYRLSMF